MESNSKKLGDYNEWEINNLEYNIKKYIKYSTKKYNLKKVRRYFINLVFDHFRVFLEKMVEVGLQYTFLDILRKMDFPGHMIRKVEVWIFDIGKKEWYTTEEVAEFLNYIIGDD